MTFSLRPFDFFLRYIVLWSVEALSFSSSFVACVFPVCASPVLRLHLGLRTWAHLSGSAHAPASQGPADRTHEATQLEEVGEDLLSVETWQAEVPGCSFWSLLYNCFSGISVCRLFPGELSSHEHLKKGKWKWAHSARMIPVSVSTTWESSLLTALNKKWQWFFSGFEFHPVSHWIWATSLRQLSPRKTWTRTKPCCIAIVSRRVMKTLLSLWPRQLRWILRAAYRLKSEKEQELDLTKQDEM